MFQCQTCAKHSVRSAPNAVIKSHFMAIEKGTGRKEEQSLDHDANPVVALLGKKMYNGIMVLNRYYNLIYCSADQKKSVCQFVTYIVG